MHKEILSIKDSPPLDTGVVESAKDFVQLLLGQVPSLTSFQHLAIVVLGLLGLVGIILRCAPLFFHLLFKNILVIKALHSTNLQLKAHKGTPV